MRIFASGRNGLEMRRVASVVELHSAFCALGRNFIAKQTKHQQHQQRFRTALTTITKVVTDDLFKTGTANQRRLIRMSQRFSGCSNGRNRMVSTIGWWTTEEHDEAMELYPSGPWKIIVQHIGTRSPRQVMTHAQKYRHRIKRRKTRKTRDKYEPSMKVATVSMHNNAILPEIAAESEPLDLLLELEVVALGPLSLFQCCKMPEPMNRDASIGDALLLAELIVPEIDSDSSSVELERLEWDQLIEMLVGPVIDWEAVCM